MSYAWQNSSVDRFDPDYVERRRSGLEVSESCNDRLVFSSFFLLRDFFVELFLGKNLQESENVLEGIVKM